jgi:polar amino acid transport system substrate-binding protein
MHRVWMSVFLQGLIVVSLVFPAWSADTLPKSAFPHLRHADPSLPSLAKLPDASLTLLTDEDFAPFSFRNGSGAMKGISVDLALAVCAEIQIKCQIVPKPYADLMRALDNKEGIAIIAGPSASENLLHNVDMTKPYFVSSAAFLARPGSALQHRDPKSLAGKRLGYVKGSVHEAFLQKYYERAALTAYENEELMLTALRSGGLDAAFMDSLRAVFWLRGADSRGCCVMLGEPITDRSGLSKGLAMMVDKSRPDVTAAFDRALDVLDEKSETAKIFARYLPSLK